MPLPAGKPGPQRPGSATSVMDLYRGRKRLALIRDLAMGEWTHRELAAQIGVKVSEVATFAAMNAEEITEVRAALAGQLAIETAGLWIAKRHNRVAEYQAAVEELQDDIERVRRTHGAGSKEHVDLTRTYLMAMKQAGDEYLPNRQEKAGAGDPAVVHYVIEADDEIIQALS